ncbi:MAG: 7-cyano-7-deazaguanine synthase QueC [Candidatus Omnitrophota bacterium]|nr:7-cyano-7-deazaguanine synthase QueC [Candidatus Omnitrophota bacterium]MDZ4241377.1 7-cyano-7-deazaguanine synthase QueC [Candidatus Omnitrophota bacterium]
MKRAIVLLSGGLDSATTLYYARSRGYRTYCLIFDYGQRHRKEITLAKRIAALSRSEYKVVKIPLPWRGSALLDKKIPLPKNRRRIPREIPVTYVPARNTIFVSFAASYAEAVGARTIFIGANAIDYSGYPDCRPEFYRAFQETLRRGLKAGVEGRPVRIETPLIRKTKAQIIELGRKLKVPYHLTWSCYSGGQRPCRRCDSCLLREKGFEALGLKDPS